MNSVNTNMNDLNRPSIDPLDSWLSGELNINIKEELLKTMNQQIQPMNISDENIEIFISGVTGVL